MVADNYFSIVGLNFLQVDRIGAYVCHTAAFDKEGRGPFHPTDMKFINRGDMGTAMYR
jgi:hypothetical protein